MSNQITVENIKCMIVQNFILFWLTVLKLLLS